MVGQSLGYLVSIVEKVCFFDFMLCLNICHMSAFLYRMIYEPSLVVENSNISKGSKKKKRRKYINILC